MNRRTKALIAVAGVVALTAAAPWLVPLDRLIPQIEAAASARVGEPVRIASLRLSLLPLPHLVATGVTAGDPALGEVSRIVLHPSLAQLWSKTMVLREVRLERVMLQQALLVRLTQLRGTAAGPARARVQRLVIEDATLQLTGATIRDLDIEVALTADGRPEWIRARCEGGRLKVTARPDGSSALLLDIAAQDWTPPAGPPIRFERIAGKAQLTRHGIASRDLQASLYGGRAAGSASVSWSQGWAIQGELEIESVNLQPVVALFVRDHMVSGRIDANPRFALRARRARDLVASLELSSDFTVRDGLLHKVDLVAAAKSPFSARTRPADEAAQTRFDELAGHLVVDRDGYHFSDLAVASGLLRASGEVSVARDRTLDGRIEAEVRGTGALFAVPMRVSGTLGSPQVQPTKSAVAAVVAGSVLLPGIGTAIGLKASQLGERLFGGGRKREPSAGK
jgi:uncharacterized protein involved in outer membrane biogenesis